MEKKRISVIKIKSIQYLTLLIYLISISAYQLQTGVDSWIVRISFLLLLFTTIFLKRKIIFNTEIFWIIIFWLYYFMSLLWASNKNDTMLCLNSAIQVISLSFIFPNIIRNKNDIDKILKLIIISLFYTSILIIIRTPFSLWGQSRIGTVTGLHENTIGIRLSTGILFCIYFLHKHEINKKEKKYYIVSMIIFILISFFTGSKKAIVILTVGIVLYELLSAKGIEILKKIFRVVLILFISFYFIMTNSLLYNVLGKRLYNYFDTTLNNSATDSSIIERNYYIIQAKQLFRQHPIIGYGGDNFMTYMREIGYSHVAYSHNNFYELLSTLGIIGFLIYYSFWFYILIELLLLYKNNKSSQTLLFLIIVFINLVLDYWHVTYYSDFNIIIMLLSYINIKIVKKELNYNKKVN